MKLSPGRYLLTATIDHNLLGLGLPAGTRVTAAVVFRASGVHSYRLTKIAPNPKGYELDEDDFMYDGWKDGHAALVKELLGHKVAIVVTARPGGGLELSGIHADTGIGLFNASGAWRRANDQSNIGEPVAPNVPPSGKPLIHATTFLRNNAKVSSHVLLSDKLTDAKRQEIIDYNKAQGYGVLYVYCANEGDYDKQSVSYDPSKRNLWRKWLGRVIESGSRVIMWGCADDSNDLAKQTYTEWRAYWGMVHDAVGDLVSEWVTGLECDERWSASETQDLTRLIKEITGKPVGVHTTGLSKVGHAAGADKFYLQTGFGKTPAQVAELVRQARAKFGGPVIAAEYSKSGDSASAKAIGDAAIAAGAAGVGNGCTAAGLSKLSATGGGSDSPDAPVGTSPTTPGAASFRMDHPRRRYVSFAGINRKGWKTKSVSGETINGALWLNGRFCEHIPEGRDNTGISNALTRGKGGVNARKGYYQPGLRKGQVVPVEVRRIDNKPTGYAGTVKMTEDAEK